MGIEECVCVCVCRNIYACMSAGAIGVQKMV